MTKSFCVRAFYYSVFNLTYKRKNKGINLKHKKFVKDLAEKNNTQEGCVKYSVSNTTDGRIVGVVDSDILKNIDTNITEILKIFNKSTLFQKRFFPKQFIS